MKTRIRKITALLCASSLAVIAAGCGETDGLLSTETEAVQETIADTAAEEAASEEEIPLAESAPVVSLAYYYDEDIYNLSVEGFQIRSEGFDELKSSLKAHNAEIKEEALKYKEALEENDESTFWNTAKITRCDTAVFSCSQEAYFYSAEADSEITTTGYSYDVYTGKELELSDVIMDMDPLMDIVIEKLKAHPDMEAAAEGWEDIAREKLSAMEGVSWYLKDDSLEFIFNTNTLSATSEIMAEVPYTEVSDYMSERYRNHSEYLCHCMDDDGDSCLEYAFDADGDGNEELLQVAMDYETDENNYVISVTPRVSFGQDEASLVTVTGDEGEMYEIGDCWVIQSPVGGYYLYIEGTSDNDHHILEIYDVSDPDVGPVSKGENETGAFYDFMPSDANAICVQNAISYMGTYSGYMICHVGENGQLQTEGEPEYRIIGYDETAFDTAEESSQPAFSLTLLQDISEYVYDISDGEGAEEEIKAGTPLYPYACAVDAYMIFKISDGKYVCLYYDDMDENTIEHTIEGIPEEELLDGMVYAG